MTRFAPLALALLLGLPAQGEGQGVLPTDQAAEPPARAQAGTAADPLRPEGLTLDDFLWTARPLIVFATSPNDPAFQRQMQLLAANPGDLLDRQVVVIADTDATAPSALRRRLRPNGFAIVLVDTNGRPLLTRPTPRTVREISSAIDKSPQRRQELQDRRSGG